MKGKRNKEADRRKGGKTISKSGQECTLPAQLRQVKTGQDGKGLLQIHLWYPGDLPRLWDRIELNKFKLELNLAIFLPCVSFSFTYTMKKCGFLSFSFILK